MSTETTIRAGFGLTDEQIALLLGSLHPSRVRQKQGQSHVEAWDVRRWLTRIFGFCGWKDEILSCVLVHEEKWPVLDSKTQKPVPGKHRCTAVYRVTLRLTVKDQWGNVVGEWDDAATGDAVNQASVGDAHDLALKTAVSQALKRCAVNLGDQFGLSLYNKGSLDATVLRTVVQMPSAPGASVPEDAPVLGGELDEEREGDGGVSAPGQAGVREPQPAQSRAQRGPQDNTEWEQPAPPRPVSDGQKKALHAMLRAKKGPLTDDQKRQGFSQFAGRQITSTNDLTYEEVRRLLDFLAGQPDYVSEEQRDGQAQAEAQQLAATAEPDVDRLESDLRDGIEAADSPAEVTAVLNRVHSQRGVLGEGRRAALVEAGRRRYEALEFQRAAMASAGAS